ncbi:MAG: hypothetical protein LBU53_01820, partial [Zoogloeaceae bacterium]|nr:hypothetical protein [Zoogloeaceae bacterium]
DPTPHINSAPFFNCATRNEIANPIQPRPPSSALIQQISRFPPPNIAPLITKKTENYTNLARVNSPKANSMIVNNYSGEPTIRAFMRSPCCFIYFKPYLPAFLLRREFSRMNRSTKKPSASAPEKGLPERTEKR